MRKIKQKLVDLLGSKTKEPEIESEKIEPEIKNGINNQYHFHEGNLLISAEPVNAGQKSKILAGYLKKDKLEEIVLSEDGEVIVSSTDTTGIISYEPINTIEKVSTYEVTIKTKDSDEPISHQFSINFTGNPIIFLPKITYFGCCENAGKASSIAVQASVMGDNPGIKEIRVYEDNQLINSGNDTALIHTQEYNTPQDHTYRVEIEDKAGNIVKSKEDISVNYSGEAFPPQLSFFSVCDEEVGKFTTFAVMANDSQNIDSLGGIEKIILYENGAPIHETPHNMLHYKAISQEAGEKIYYVEVINKNGLTTKSDTKKITFTLEDYTPGISWLNYDFNSENNTLSILAHCLDNSLNLDSGIKEIRLYEDGELIEKTQNNKFLNTKISRNKSSHKYHLEVENLSGLVLKSKEETVNYN